MKQKGDTRINGYRHRYFEHGKVVRENAYTLKTTPSLILHVRYTSVRTQQCPLPVPALSQ